MMLSGTLDAGLARFDRLSARERILIAAAVLAVVIGLWDLLFRQPLEARRTALLAEIDQLQQSNAMAAAAAQSATVDDAALQMSRELANDRIALDAVNRQLLSASVGLVAPERMAEAIGDVLRQRGNIALVSLRNEPARPLLSSAADGVTDTRAGAPYVHTIEVVLTGNYLDLLAYVRGLEALRWHFYWKSLELQSLGYPRNRVRLELSTLSLDSSWLGV